MQIFKLLQFTVSILALAYLQALMSYYERQVQDCKIHLKGHKIPKEGESDVTQAELADFKREESQVDFIDVDNSAGASDLSEPLTT